MSGETCRVKVQKSKQRHRPPPEELGQKTDKACEQTDQFITYPSPRNQSFIASGPALKDFPDQLDLAKVRRYVMKQ
jgi:hypothetical protein